MERAVLLEEGCHLDALVDPQAAGDAVGHVELGRDRHVRADGVAHGAQDGAGEAGPVLDRAAELVVTPVQLGAEEGAQEVVVPDVDFDAVEARLGDERGGAAVVVGDALDAGGVDGAQARAHGGQATRGGQGRGAVGARVGHRPGVADLGRRRRTLSVDGVGEAAQPGQVLLVQQEAVAVRAPFGRHGQVGHGGQGGAAGGHAAVEVDQRVADGATRHHAFEGGRLDDAVAQRQRAQGRRREDGRRRGGLAGGAGRHGPTFADPRGGRTFGSLNAGWLPTRGAAAGRRRRRRIAWARPPGPGRGSGCGWSGRPAGRRRHRWRPR